jgi:predicted PurR-regulated permease PerM
MAGERLRKKYTHQFVLAAIIILGGLILFTMRSFIDAFLGAVTLYVLFRPMMRNLVEVRKWPRGGAAVLILFVSFLIVLIPIIAITYMIVPKVSLFFSDSSLIMSVLNSADAKIQALTGYELMTQENIRKVQESAGEFITRFLGESMGILADIAVLYFLFYYFLVSSGKVEQFFENYLPLSKENTGRLTEELETQTFSNALGGPLLALIQGIFAALGYWLFGLQEPVFWGLMTGFFSFLPVAGSMLIWLPAAIYQLSTGMIWQGVAIFAYGILVISVVDNVFRFVFQKKFADVHPLITVIGVIVGLQLFGVPGIIFGPLLISYFLIMLRIFREEFLSV